MMFGVSNAILFHLKKETYGVKFSLATQRSKDNSWVVHGTEVRIQPILEHSSKSTKERKYRQFHIYLLELQFQYIIV